MGVVLYLGPGEPRQLDGFANTIDGHDIQVAGDAIGLGRITMSPTGAGTHPETHRPRPNLARVSHASSPSSWVDRDGVMGERCLGMSASSSARPRGRFLLRRSDRPRTRGDVPEVLWLNL